MRAGMIDMESNTTLVQNFPAHEAIPDGTGPFPAAVVFHDRFGLSTSVRGVANRLAQQGFYTLVPNFYALPSSFASVAPDFMRTLTIGSYDYRDAAAARERGLTLTDERAEAVFRQAFTFLATRSRVRSGGVGVLGFSMGGRLAFLSACDAPAQVRACVGFYPAGLGGSAPMPVGQASRRRCGSSTDCSTRRFVPSSGKGCVRPSPASGRTFAWRSFGTPGTTSSVPSAILSGSRPRSRHGRRPSRCSDPSSAALMRFPLRRRHESGDWRAAFSTA
jgi:dienelactone hydrolase